MPDAQPGFEQIVETDIFRTIDQRAADALERLLAPELGVVDGVKQAWATFIVSLWQRAPANLIDTHHALEAIKIDSLGMREEYPNMRRAEDPATYDDFMALRTDGEKRGSAVRTAVEMIGKTNIARILTEIHWLAIDIPTGPALLLSDDSLARNNGLAKKEGHFAMPLSPSRLLVGAWHPHTLATFENAKPRELAKAMNRWTVESAKEFVVAPSDRQDFFIRKHFGRDPKPTLADIARRLPD